MEALHHPAIIDPGLAVEVSLNMVEPSSDKHATGILRRLKIRVMGHRPNLALSHPPALAYGLASALK